MIMTFVRFAEGTSAIITTKLYLCVIIIFSAETKSQPLSDNNNYKSDVKIHVEFLPTAASFGVTMGVVTSTRPCTVPYRGQD